MNARSSLILFIFALSVIGLAQDANPPILSAVAKTVSVEERSLVFTTHEKGQRFMFEVDTTLPRLLAYNETVKLSAGFEKASFRTRHLTIHIARSTEGPNIYEVTEIVDQRSVGKARVTTLVKLRLFDKSLEILSTRSLPSSN